MSVQACAELVRRGDPDRFLATMAAPPASRAVLFPIWAFNLEVARAPWVTAEPLIAQMRLQWWRDVLGEIAEGGMVRQHEVTLPLAHVLDPGAARMLDGLILARHHDIDGPPFADAAALDSYLADTSGQLLAVAARALGVTDSAQARELGTAGGFASFLMAMPALIAAGRPPLSEAVSARTVDLAGQYLERFEKARKAQPAALKPAALTLWRCRAILRQARRDPAAAVEGRLGGSEFARRTSLLRAQMFGI